jgi:hypothetical protein
VPITSATITLSFERRRDEHAGSSAPRHPGSPDYRPRLVLPGDAGVFRGPDARWPTLNQPRYRSPNRGVARAPWPLKARTTSESGGSGSDHERNSADGLSRRRYGLRLLVQGGGVTEELHGVIHPMRKTQFGVLLGCGALAA